jgi:CDP-paratose 2-epimerase
MCGSVGDRDELDELLTTATAVFHLAAQVAVTLSVQDPFHDFYTNLFGTVNVLEALRTRKNPPPLVFASTKNVYGQLRHVRLRKSRTTL